MQIPRTVPRRVLMIEDHPGFARLVELTLTDALGGDIELVLAASWAQARSLLQGGEFAGILLDLALPDEAGAHLIDLVRGAAPGVPVVVLTGSTAPELEADLRARGAAGVVSKDDTQSTLAPTLQGALEHHETRRCQL